MPSNHPVAHPLTYREFREMIRSAVRMLNNLGFCRNDRLAIISPAGPETAVCIIAVMAGFTAVSLNPQFTGREFSEIFNRLRIKAIIIQRDLATTARAVATERKIPVIDLVPVTDTAGQFTLLPEAPQECDNPEFAVPSDTACILLTSGTTAESKVIPVSQKQISLSRTRSGFFQGLTPDDRCLHIIPYYHGMGIGAALLSPLIAGGYRDMHEELYPGRFLFPCHDLPANPLCCRACGPAGHPPGTEKAASGALEVHSLQYIRSGSGFLPLDIRTELESVLNVPVVEAYGMSETGTVAINIPPKKGSVGIPFIESLRIIDHKGHELGPSMTGEIVIRDPAVFSGYENAPEETRAAFVNGWFRTGDMGYLDSDGYLFLTGVGKEMINKGGEKISPAEIDTVLMSHPLVIEAMAFPVSDPVFGEDIGALVIREHESLSEDTLRRYLLDHLTLSKLPRRIYFVDRIPKTPSGKPIRGEATRRYPTDTKQ